MTDHTERARGIVNEIDADWSWDGQAIVRNRDKAVRQAAIEAIAAALIAVERAALERAASLIEESPRNPLGAARRIRALAPGET